MNQNDLCLIINIGSLRLNDDKIVAIPIICLYFTLSGFDNLVRNNGCFSYQKGIIEDMGRPPTRPKKLKDGYYIEVRNNIANIDQATEARKIRYNDRFREKGVNVNFVELKDRIVHIRTYERGVEDETLACGTGVTAVAIAMHKTHKTVNNSIILPVEGGILEVSFEEENGMYKNVFLKGPAKLVFQGNMSI